MTDQDQDTARRDRMTALAITNAFYSTHGVPLPDAIVSALAQARAEEREACAKVLDEESDHHEYVSKECFRRMELGAAEEHQGLALQARHTAQRIRRRDTG